MEIEEASNYIPKSINPYVIRSECSHKIEVAKHLKEYINNL